MSSPGEAAGALTATVALTGTVLLGSWLTARRLFADAEPSERGLATGSIACALIGYPLVACGAAGAISSASVIAIGALAILAAFATRRWAAPGPGRPLPPAIPLGPGAWVAAGLLLCVAVVALQQAMSVSPTSHRVWNENLPRVVEWARAGSLTSHHPLGEATGYAPATGDLFTLWMLFWARGDALPGLVGVAWTLLQGISVFRIARELGVSRPLAPWAAVSYLLTPQVQRFAGTAAPEPALWALLLTSLAWLLAYRRTRRQRELALFAATLGLAVGVEVRGLLAAVPLLALAAHCLGSGANRPRGRALVLALAVIVVCVLAGGYWYWRNLLETGSLLPGEILGHPWALARDLWSAAGPKLLPLVLLALVAVIRDGRDAALAGALAAAWALTNLAAGESAASNTGLAFPAPSLAVVAALAARCLNGAKATTATVLFAFLVLPDLLLGPFFLSGAGRTWLLLAAGLAAVLAVLPRRPGWRPWMVVPIAVVAAALFVLGGLASRAQRAAPIEESAPGDASRPLSARGAPARPLPGSGQARGWRWLDRKLQDHPVRIAFAGTGVIYPLYGPTWTRRLFRLEDRSRAHSPRRAWSSDLRRMGARFLVLNRRDSRAPWPPQVSWADRHLVPLARGLSIRVYGVRP